MKGNDLGTLAVGLWCAVMAACGSTAAAPTTPAAAATAATTAGAPPSSAVQAMYALFGNGVQVSFDGAIVTLRTTNLPDHPSPYYGQGHPLYEAPHAGMVLNPNRIASQNIVFRVPAAPTVATASDTPMGPIGVAVNGVVFFNQYAAMRMPLTAEIATFDRFLGHPQQNSQYHYHMEPTWLTASSRSRLVGVLLDGFPVYGPADADGRAPADLDSCHGHVGVTAEFPAGIYHYHANTEAPYLSGCFRGAAGTVG